MAINIGKNFLLALKLSFYIYFNTINDISLVFKLILRFGIRMKTGSVFCVIKLVRRVRGDKKKRCENIHSVRRKQKLPTL